MFHFETQKWRNLWVFYSLIFNPIFHGSVGGAGLRTSLIFIRVQVCVQPILTSPTSSSLIFSSSRWKIYQVFRVQADKSTNPLLDLIALFFKTCYFSRSLHHKQVSDDLSLNGMVNKKYFFSTIFWFLNFIVMNANNFIRVQKNYFFEFELCSMTEPFQVRVRSSSGGKHFSLSCWFLRDEYFQKKAFFKSNFIINNS